MIYLGIDSGTQSTKTIVLDFESGDVLASASCAHQMVCGLPQGHLEQHPQEWIDATQKSICECLEKLDGRKEEIRGIGVSGQQHGLVVLDEHDEVIRPAKLWCDTSTIEECAAFSSEFGGDAALVELAGNAMLPGYTAPKVLWLKRNEPENFSRMRSVLLPHDYINFWLTGLKRMECGDASGTALLNIRTRQWSEPLCDFIEKGFADRLPPLGSSAGVVGTLREELRRSWGLSTNPIVSAGGGDNMMGAIGTGNVKEGVFTVSLGTSGTLYAFSKKPILDRDGEVAGFCDSTDNWLPLVCTMNVTVATEQVRKLFGWSIEQFNDAVATAPAGSEGLHFLPFLNGERTPNLPEGKGVFYGLTVGNMTAPLMARATMEGVTLGLAYGLERFRAFGLSPREIRLTGGGSKSKVWCKMAADIFGVQTVGLKTSEGAALGAALQAAWSDSGRYDFLPEITARLVQPDEETRIQPDSETYGIYADALLSFKGLTRQLLRGGYL